MAWQRKESLSASKRQFPWDGAAIIVLGNIKIPKAAATSKSPSLETRSAFLHHRCAPSFKHKDVRWNKEIQEWFCVKCGRTSDHTAKDDALTELEQYECELPTPDSGKSPNEWQGVTFQFPKPRFSIRVYSIVDAFCEVLQW